VVLNKKNKKVIEEIEEQTIEYNPKYNPILPNTLVEK
jgi:hypothetical protein